MNNSPEPLSPRQRLSLDCGWRFHLGDIAFPVISGHTASYQSAKAGRATGAAAVDYDDTEWRQLDLPHDWVVEGPFDANANLAQGYRHRGFGWYRRHFRLEASDRGQHLELQFDGIATHATVWVNGSLVHRNFCGYTSFAIDITSFARFGDELNCVAVRVDAEQQEGWWYEGGGIYRPTWLVKRSPVHIITDGVFAQPVRAANGRWSIPVEVTLANAGAASRSVAVDSVLADTQGNTLVRGDGTSEVPPLRNAVVHYTLAVDAPHLWSVDSPILYQVITTVRLEGEVVDRAVTPAGFRTLKFDADQGFYLNDQPLKIKGTCNHQDHAGVGVAVPAALWEFRLKRLKEMGSNAYRCAHHPPAKELLEAADRLGLLVMDENRLFNPAPEYLKQLEWLVRRDRNHPCVFLWSVFNEEPMQGTEQGYEMVRRLVACVKGLDPTRFVTAAMNGGLFAQKNVAQVVDVVGFNYQIEAYDRFHDANPEKPLISSEDSSALMQRDEYSTDPEGHLLDAYDTQKPAWGATHREAWRQIAERSFIAGGFAWTGFDYRGEPTPYEWPSAGSSVGCLDQCGFAKTAFYIRQALWIHDRPVLQLVPHWNWTGREGGPIKVMAITNLKSVELFLNGHSLGEKSVEKYEMVEWTVAYAPGKLEAVGRFSTGEAVRFVVETTGEPTQLRLVSDRVTLAADGRDTVPVTVEALDSAGRRVPTATCAVEFTLGGEGAIIGVGNGDPNSHEPEKGNGRRLHHGLAQVLVQSRSVAGVIQLRARSAGLKEAQLELVAEPTLGVASVPAGMPVLQLARWRHSPQFAQRPDPNQLIAANDQNSWGFIEAGNLHRFTDGNWMIYRASFRPYQAQRTKGGRVFFKAITGCVEVWLDDRLIGTKTRYEREAFAIEFPAGSERRTISLLFRGEPGQSGGLDLPALIEPNAD